LANFGFRQRDRTATDFINDCVEQAHMVRKEYEPQWQENWSNYRVESTYNRGETSKADPNRLSQSDTSQMSPVNFLKTPESHQGVNTLRALLLAGLFGVRDYVQADPVGDEDIEAAKRVSRLTMYGTERPGNFRTVYESLGDSLIFGLGSWSGRWRRDVRLVPRRFPVPDPTAPGELLRDPETGSIMTVLKNVEVPVYDDVALETDDLFDTWFDPSANRFEQLQWKVKRFRIRDEQLVDLMDNPNWDVEGIRQVLRQDPGERQERATGPDGDEHPKLLTENLTYDDIKNIKEFGYYGGWVYEGMVPKEVAQKIGKIDHRGMVIIRVIDGIVVQAIQSSQRSGLIQGGSITIMPSGRGLYGISPLTIVRYLQDVSDTQLILTVQALIESVYQNYLVGGEYGPNFARDLETRRPREVFTLQGEIEQIAPLPKDYTGLQISVGALSVISQTIRQAMNARDPVQGQLKQTGDTTATESQIVAAAAMQNTDQLAMLIERDELPVLGRIINDLYYINLDDDAKVFRRVGETETTSVSYADIDMVTDINFIGARSVLNKAGRANQFRDFAQMVSSNPFTAAAMDWHAFIQRYGDEAMDVRGLEQLMLKDPEEVVARMQAMGLANTVAPQVQGSKGAPPGQGSPAAKSRTNPGTGGRSGGNTPAQNSGENQ